MQHGYHGGRRLGYRLLFQLQFALCGRAVLRAASHAVSLTQLGAGFLRSLGADPARLRVIPTGVDCTRFAAAEPHGGPARFGFVGRVERDKGIFTLLDALAALPKGSASLTCIGDGADLDEARIAAAARALPVSFTGRVEHERLPQLLRQLDVLCVPTHHAEPFGIVAVEAAAAGLPVIASRLGGLAETVRDGDTGLLVAPGSLSELTAAMAKLAADAPLRARLGRRARAVAEAHYAWPRIAAAFEALLHEAVGSREPVLAEALS